MRGFFLAIAVACAEPMAVIDSGMPAPTVPTTPTVPAEDPPCECEPPAALALRCPNGIEVRAGNGYDVRELEPGVFENAGPTAVPNRTSCSGAPYSFAGDLWSMTPQGSLFWVDPGLEVAIVAADQFEVRKGLETVTTYTSPFGPSAPVRQ